MWSFDLFKEFNYEKLEGDNLTKTCEDALKYYEKNYESAKTNIKSDSWTENEDIEDEDEQEKPLYAVQYQLWDEPDHLMKNVQYSERDYDEYDPEKIAKFLRETHPTLNNDYVRKQNRKQVLNESYNNSTENKTKTVINRYINSSFVHKMKDVMKKNGLYAPNVYKAANIDRKLFSKIYNDETYKPAKDTCIAICIGLKLDLFETRNLLERAGYTLSHSIARDVIIEYCINNNIWPVDNVNAVLSRLEYEIL